MKQTFRAINKNGELLESHTFNNKNTYADTLNSAIEWFSGLGNKDGFYLALINNTDFKKRKMSKQMLFDYLAKLESLSCGSYRVVESDNYVDDISIKTKMVIVGSARPWNVSFPYTGSNDKIFNYISRAKNVNLKVYFSDVDQLKKELDKMGIIFIDIATSFLIADGCIGDDDILAFESDDSIIEKLKEAKEKNPNLVIVPATSNAREMLNKYYSIETHKLLSLVSSYHQRPDEWINLLKETI